jgi:pilus assembly protein CpaC
MTLLRAKLTHGLRLALAVGASALVAVPGLAQERRDVPPPAYAAGISRTINMAVGKSIIVDLPQDAAEVFIGNPATANAVVRSTRKLYIVAIANGVTSIYAMDKAGRQIAAFQINVGRDIGELQQIFRAALPRDNIVVRTVSDTIILSGTVESAGDAQQAMDIAKGFIPTLTTPTGGAASPEGQVINSLIIKGKDQVMLKVAIIEVERTIVKELGISTSGTWSTGTFGPSPVALSGISAGTSALQNTWGSTTGNSFSATLQALEKYGVSRVLAEPTVTAISGESAKFTAGGEIPVPTSFTPGSTGLGIATPATVGIEFKQYGVTLNFTPVVLAEGRILLRLATEVTEIDPDRIFTFPGGITVNGFRTRKNETSVELPSGGSIVSAGLLQTNNRQVITGLPALMNLPILGALFRSRDYQRDETELMIVVTPYIARSLNPDELARPDDGLADASDPQGWFLGRITHIYATPNNPERLQNFRGKVGFITD